jgi:hypothetical protein
MPSFEEALRLIDAIHSEDPAQEEAKGRSWPAELLYAERMSARLKSLVQAPSEILRIAARAQHLGRFRTPRSEFPSGQAGYHRWRKEAAKRHAEAAAEAMREAGYAEAPIEKVARLIRKQDLGRDEEAQALEDCACLVFLEHHLVSFAEGKREDALLRILRKTWAKMSPRAHALALSLSLPEALRARIAEATAGT